MNGISAVICELNPLHAGHRYIFKKAREYGNTVIAVMSGNFVQRGECAVFDKYKRAKAALECADLVVELPFPWSASSAEFFARAGVGIAEKLGADKLVFGSESGDINAIRTAAAVLNGPAFRKSYKGAMAAGAKREELLRSLCPELPDSLYSSPNDILGCEYCRFLSAAEPVCIKRTNCESASALRAEMKNKGAYCEKLFDTEFIFLRTSKHAPYAAECGGGVGERLYKAAFASCGGTEMFEKAATKQYTQARFRRAALFAVSGVTTDMLRRPPEYTVVLAANEKGRRVLSQLRKTSEIDILTNPSDGGKLRDLSRIQFEASAFVDTIYTLCMVDNVPSDVFLKKNPSMV